MRGEKSAVTYDTAKTELVLFSRARQRRLNQQVRETTVLIGGEKIKFNKEATRWLGIWLDSKLKFTAHINKRLTKAKTAEIQVKRLSGSYGLAPGLVRRIQIAAVQSIALYGAELWWRGQKNHECKVQQLINRKARAITGMYPSTPIQALMSEAGQVPAQILLNHRQRMYAYRLLTSPNDHPTRKILPISFGNGDAYTFRAEDQPEDTLTWAGSEKPTSLGQWLARQVSIMQAVDPAYGVEPIERSWRLNTDLPLQVVLQPKREAIQEAKRNQAGIFYGVRSTMGWCECARILGVESSVKNMFAILSD